MKKHILVVLAFIIVFVLQAPAPVFSGTAEPDKEQKERKHMIYADLGGFALLYSIGYGYQFYEKWEITVGIGHLSINSSKKDNPDDTYFILTSIPLVISRTFGENRYKLELKAGIQFLRHDSNLFANLFNFGEPKTDHLQWFISPGLGAGFRYNFKRYDLILSANAIYRNSLSDNDSMIFLWPGIRLGYRF